MIASNTMRVGLDRGAWLPPPGLLAERALRPALIVPGVARVYEVPAPPGVKRAWRWDGWTDAFGRLRIPLDLAIAFVRQGALTGAGTTTETGNPGGTVSAGNALLLATGAYNSSGAAANPTLIADTQTNTWTRDVTVLSATLTNRMNFIASAPNAVGGTNPTITITWAAGAYFAHGTVLEVSGLATSSMLDATGFGSAVASSTGPTLAVTTTTADTFLLAHMGSEATNTRTVTPTTGTQLAEYETGGSGPIFNAQYSIESAAGSKTHTWTVSSTAANWAVLMAAYVIAAGGGGGRIMSSLAGAGGLAGKGGIAGPGGGLAG